MINLTPDPITLIAESGETTTIPASGYVARVETTRREVSSWHNAAPDQEFDVPIIEETPTEIIVGKDNARRKLVEKEHFPCEDEFGVGEGAGLLLVSREVAESAHVLRHPLAGRMVWASDRKVLEYNYDDGTDEVFGFHYHSFRRVPQL